MFCSACGMTLDDSAVFCPACGERVGGRALTPRAGRVAGHIRLLGILWLALSVLRLIPGLALLLIFGGGWSLLGPRVPGFVPALLAMLGVFLSLGALVGIATGWGLLSRERWARVVAIVMGCLNLMDVPFGTALGIYTLWVLLPVDSEREYAEIGRPGAPAHVPSPAPPGSGVS